ncbi:hypothetical protein JRQ81_018703 [Phrynocephalus forsythii]|uniref:Uncharacterized protein n=1 Tax=Phrynocephalus forsythii TaxID=171643 RepID=A0A9Q1AZ05_9SAUR|nr:hypothetical protein JRQ81_018703 [Phrynocephalus forsythii]
MVWQQEQAMGQTAAGAADIISPPQATTGAAPNMYRADGVQLSEIGSMQGVAGIQKAIGDWVQLQCSGREPSETLL